MKFSLACSTPPRDAPSVGLMQPWRFILIRDAGVRQNVYEIFKRAYEAASSIYEDEQKALYNSLKLSGILEAPVNLCVICDSNSKRGHGLGRQTMPETAVYSTVCAIENLWLAARAEGVGVCWVSIFRGIAGVAGDSSRDGTGWVFVFGLCVAVRHPVGIVAQRLGKACRSGEFYTF
ncbi:MAG: 5,6-dimethylbenzimidazole synthase [Oscillatoria sp. Prado101]|jgi:5,6-dimethylbenzimidazole synthase|nr:5,6-dimethylbenzimidazole synthase [Oscillatoria sp. Prado101]